MRGELQINPLTNTQFTTLSKVCDIGDLRQSSSAPGARVRDCGRCRLSASSFPATGRRCDSLNDACHSRCSTFFTVLSTRACSCLR